MIKDTFETIEEEGRCLYTYLRGSHCHGIAVEGKSDYDYGGVFMSPQNNLLDLGFNYQGQISNESNDIVWYELRKFMQLLIKSNPTILEALFVDDKYVKYEHPLFTEIKKNKEIFLTKKCFPSFFSYAKSQIEKATGLNKMINWDKEEMKRKTPYDFAYTFYKQGSTKIRNWLENRGLKQEFCGLVHIPNMHDTYGVYYDWGAHFAHYKISCAELEYYLFGRSFKDIILDRNKIGILKDATIKNAKFIADFYDIQSRPQFREWFDKNKEVIHYRGMCLDTSTDMRGSSVSKGEKPLCWMVYNENGFKAHCVKYKQYEDWIKHRNPIRYESNLKKSYDAKNMCECFRLMHCGIEIAEGKGYIVDRSGIDAEFLLDVKNHKFEYEFLMSKLKDDNEKMKEAINNSKIFEDIDPNFVNELYLKIINNFF